MEEFSAAIQLTEVELIEKAKTNDQAFEILYNQYFPKIYGFVIKRTGAREAAEDIVSMVFMDAFTHLDKYEHRNFTFGAWLYKIATNKLIDHYRREGKRKTVALEDNLADSLPDEAQGQEVSVDLKLSCKTVSAVLAELPEKYQKILYLKFFSELSNNEIALALEISVNNAGVLLYRALQKFKKHYHKYV